MTMVNSTISSTPNNRGGVSLRKTNKPLMEKRRRARINDSLTQLKSLVIHSSKKDSSQFSKLEKADILELTVKHLRGLQAQQQQQLQQQHHHQQHQHAVQSAPNGTAETLVNGKYRAGFVECANEVIRYLDQSQGLNMETKNKVVSHLAGCLQLVSASQNQSKIAPQPIPQQSSAPPNNAAAILAAAAAAAGNTTTTTTQLPNGQIIQIVHNPLQNVQPASDPSILGLKAPSAPCSTTTIQGINLSTHTAQGMSQISQPSGNGSTAQTNKPISNQATTTHPAYIHYAQPLHIQIPPMVSPVLIQKSQPQQTKPTELRESTNTFSSSSSRSSNHSSPPEQVHDVVSSSTSLASSPPRVSTSPPTLYPGHPKARAQKQLNFFSQDDHKSDKFSKCMKYPMTPSSSSSSSSESENTSPLNLSQSPPFCVYKAEQCRPHLFSSVSQKNFYDPKNAMLLKEGNNMSISNTPSVITNSKRCAEFHWSMMEDERQCIRHQNTPSPASSVGEERLWRPW